MVKPTEVRWLVQLQQRHFIGENVKPMHLSQNRVTTTAAVVPGRIVAAHRKTFESTCLRVADLCQRKDRNNCQPPSWANWQQTYPNHASKNPDDVVGSSSSSSQSGTIRPGDSLPPLSPQSDARSVEEPLALLYAVIECRIADVLLVWVRLLLNLAARSMRHVNITLLHTT